MQDDQSNNDGNQQQPTDEDEWQSAHENQYGPLDNLGSDKGGDDDNKSDDSGNNSATGTGNDGDTSKKSTGDEADADNQDDKSKTGQQEEGDEDDANRQDDENQKSEYDPTIAVARRTQREIAQQLTAYKDDVREKLYPDLKNELQDSEGKPIKSARDLLRLENPNTGKAFTEEEAGLFFIQAQSHLASQNEAAEARIEQVADVLMTVTEESQAVKAKWGPLLAELDKAQPGFSDNLLARYKQNLEIDKESGMIVGYKLSPQDFYDTVLAGYELAAKALRTGEEKVATVEEEKRKTETKLDKARRKSDRSDVTSGSNTDTRSSDDAEWDAAIENQYPGYSQRNNKKKN